MRVVEVTLMSLIISTTAKLMAILVRSNSKGSLSSSFSSGIEEKARCQLIYKALKLLMQA
jgi:hypothetical protein